MCITSAIPDMPMPPMPMKWMVPMSVPTPFIPTLRRSGIGSLGDWGQHHFLGRHRVGAEIAAGALDEVGKVARRLGPADRARPRRGIGERLRIEAELLHLLGELHR